jgi:ribosomal protein L23
MKENKKISFSMIKKFIYTEKTKNSLEKYNKVVIIADRNLDKFSLMALFESIDCKISKVTSCVYKPEKKIIKNNKKIFVDSFKKFYIDFDDNVDVVNIVKNINEKKIDFVL